MRKVQARALHEGRLKLAGGPDRAQTQCANPLLTWEGYKPDKWFWEAADMGRKFLTLLLPFVTSDKMLELIRRDVVGHL